MTGAFPQSPGVTNTTECLDSIKKDSFIEKFMILASLKVDLASQAHVATWPQSAGAQRQPPPRIPRVLGDLPPPHTHASVTLQALQAQAEPLSLAQTLWGPEDNCSGDSWALAASSMSWAGLLQLLGSGPGAGPHSGENTTERTSVVCCWVTSSPRVLARRGVI